MIDIDTVHGMEFSMDDKEMYQDMVQMFIEQKTENAASITDFFEKKDWFIWSLGALNMDHILIKLRQRAYNN